VFVSKRFKIHSGQLVNNVSWIFFCPSWSHVHREGVVSRSHVTIERCQLISTVYLIVV
jgi:hypothetical protein